MRFLSVFSFIFLAFIPPMLFCAGINIYLKQPVMASLCVVMAVIDYFVARKLVRMQSQTGG